MAARAVRRMYRIPIAKTIPMPGATQGLEGAVFCFQPLAESGLGSLAEALLNSALIPHVVAQGGRLVAISFDQGGQEFSGRIPDVVIVQAERRAAGCAAAANRRKAFDTVAVDVARVGVFVPHPLRRAIDDFSDHYLDAVLPFEFHHAVIVAPVVPARRVLNRRPHGPWAQGVAAPVR